LYHWRILRIDRRLDALQARRSGTEATESSVRRIVHEFDNLAIARALLAHRLDTVSSTQSQPEKLAKDWNAHQRVALASSPPLPTARRRRYLQLAGVAGAALLGLAMLRDRTAPGALEWLNDEKRACQAAREGLVNAQGAQLRSSDSTLLEKCAGLPSPDSAPPASHSFPS
jgi:hypothetical protein